MPTDRHIDRHVRVLLRPPVFFASETQTQSIVMDQQTLNRLFDQLRIESLSDLEQQSLVPMMWIAEVVVEKPMLDRSERNVTGDDALFGPYYLSRIDYR